MTAAEHLDRYLLGEPVSKPEVVSAVLSDRAAAGAAAPFYRALEAVGVRAAEEALMALRLVLAQRPVDDAAVRRLRALAGLARAGATGDRAGCDAVLRRDAAMLGDIPATLAPRDLSHAARAAYFREVGR